MKHLFIVVLSVLSLCSNAYATELSPLVVRHIAPQGDKDLRNSYFIDLLNLVLTKTEQELGPFRLASSKATMSQDRSLLQLQNNNGIDVVWTMSTAEREEALLPIRIPLLKGLLGQRLLMIRQQDIARFAKVESLEDLQAFSAGQGSGWPDNKILQANQIEVVEGMNYQGLFGMLQRQRFDYFPRGINEIFDELEQHKSENFVAEPHLVISYRAPIYFFVSKQNSELAARIEQGLWIAFSDGSFDVLFSHYQYDKLANELKSRSVIKLNNPYLHASTPSEQSPLWIKVE
ncbi:transporter substrate-binding domain-containing protein [Agarivorans sp. Alg241-V36]|uniref:transporter substrate-binding domain-containing protein n=1 Tax=Agarivorans sp. Alg241-V36 TaxID=2305992 RepID=UPI0013D21A0E|nr:transporter substrate-binding domain-containing protein [Agarivorans sp. Alg241-V36]